MHASVLGHRVPSCTSLPPLLTLSALTPAPLHPQDIYESFDMRQRRASSPGYIDSPTYSRQGMSPTIPRSPHHFYRSGEDFGCEPRLGHVQTPTQSRGHPLLLSGDVSGPSPGKQAGTRTQEWWGPLGAGSGQLRCVHPPVLLQGEAKGAQT